MRFIRRKHCCSRNCLSALAGALMFGAALLPDGHISFVSDVARTRRGTGTVLAGRPGDIRIKRDFHDDLILRFPLIAPLARCDSVSPALVSVLSHAGGRPEQRRESVREPLFCRTSASL